MKNQKLAKRHHFRSHKFIEQRASSETICVSQGRSKNRDIPLAEVRLNSKEIVIRISKTFAQKEKPGKIF
jgi:hypothetical protein